jgi:hypothetical protein
VGAWGLVLTLAVGALSGCGVFRGKTSAELLGFRAGPGANQITLVYGAGPADDPGVAEVLSQDATEVKVRVRYRVASGKQEDVLKHKEVVVTLDAPLGERSVVGEDGNMIKPTPMPH